MPTEEERFEAILKILAALLRLTSQDIRLGDPEATEFINSEWFNTICEYLGLNTDKVKKIILTSPVKSRTSYE
jgi:hypothetical protein